VRFKGFSESRGPAGEWHQVSYPALFPISEVVLYTMSIIVFETPMGSVQELFFSYPVLLDELPFTMITTSTRTLKQLKVI
jgi:hypothetical protein